MSQQDSIREAAQLLKQSKSILFITGAGISADSGLPTYRGIGGLYNSNDAEENLPIERLLSGQTLATRPDLTWKHLLEIEKACRGAQPNRGHAVIAEMEAHFERVWVLTQNVDGFHRQAGSSNVIDIHGDLHGIRCTRCRYSTEVANYAGFTLPPRCPECQSILRPTVILFGELLPTIQTVLYEDQMQQGFDLVFTIGTSSVFPYIVSPVIQAYRQNKPVIEINPIQTDVSEYANVQLRMGAAEALDAIWRAYQGGE
jgi:NAD-dependent deacetylase